MILAITHSHYYILFRTRTHIFRDVIVECLCRTWENLSGKLTHLVSSTMKIECFNIANVTPDYIIYRRDKQYTRLKINTLDVITWNVQVELNYIAYSHSISRSFRVCRIFLHYSSLWMVGDTNTIPSLNLPNFKYHTGTWKMYFLKWMSIYCLILWSNVITMSRKQQRNYLSSVTKRKILLGHLDHLIKKKKRTRK